MTNTSPKTGDERYIPLSWKVSEEHTWSSAPYEAAFTINQAGSYTLQVTFRKQTYSNNSWVNTSTTSVKSVNFKMASVYRLRYGEQRKRQQFKFRLRYKDKYRSKDRG